MNEREQHLKNNAEKKAKIRERYKGVDQNELEVIPAIKDVGLEDEGSEKRVGVYVRVSTDDPNQTSSYELQKNHYQDLVNRHPGWSLIKIYADEGISGTSLNHRDEFVRMIADCEAGNLDLIITKSVSRFARNVLDCIGHVRKLAALPHPVGVLFETENLYTLNSNSEMALSFISTLAQEESHTKSDIMNASIEMRFSRGIFLTPELLGYDKDEDGNLIINEDEAKTVRLCFFLYLYGYSTAKIAEILTALGRRTKRGNTTWSSGTVIGVLRNERHCGDVLSHKTYTPNYLNHKSKKNRQNRPQYRKRDHHDPIVSRDDFLAVQRLLSNAKFGYRGLLPSIHVIGSGALKGFITINPRWSAFSAQDYLDAAGKVEQEAEGELQAEVEAGDFDLRGYEIAHGQFFHGSGNIYVTFSCNGLQFSISCIRRFEKKLYVELLFDPVRKLFAVRPTEKDDRHGVEIGTMKGETLKSRRIPGSAFMPILYDLLEWKRENKYRVRGVKRQKGEESVMLFDLHDTEVFIPVENILHDPSEDSTDSLLSAKRKSVVAYPAEWADGFGKEFYAHGHSPELQAIDRHGEWNVSQQGTPVLLPDIHPTGRQDLESSIQSILDSVSQEVSAGE